MTNLLCAWKFWPSGTKIDMSVCFLTYVSYCLRWLFLIRLNGVGMFAHLTSNIILILKYLSFISLFIFNFYFAVLPSSYIVNVLVFFNLISRSIQKHPQGNISDINGGGFNRAEHHLAEIWGFHQNFLVIKRLIFQNGLGMNVPVYFNIKKSVIIFLESNWIFTFVHILSRYNFLNSLMLGSSPKFFIPTFKLIPIYH